MGNGAGRPLDRLQKAGNSLVRQCLGMIEQSFGAGADYRDARAGKLFEVGGNVQGGLGAVMHTHDAARGENADAGQVRAYHGGGDRGGARLSCGQGVRQVVPAEFQHALRRSQGLEFAILEAHADGGRHGAGGADLRFQASHRRHIFGIRHAMGDDGGFQRHHRPARLQGVAHFLGDSKRGHTRPRAPLPNLQTQIRRALWLAPDCRTGRRYPAGALEAAAIWPSKWRRPTGTQADFSPHDTRRFHRLLEIRQMNPFSL